MREGVSTGDADSMFRPRPKVAFFAKRAAGRGEGCCCEDGGQYAPLPIVGERRQVVPAVRPHDGIEGEAGGNREPDGYDGFFSSGVVGVVGVVVASAGS